MPRLPLTRLVYRAAVLPAAQQQAALYLGVIIAAAIIFQPVHGLRSVQLTSLMAISPAARLVIWGGWLLLTLPAARALLRAPALVPLRALPVQRWRLLLALLLPLLVAELPMGLLHLRGVGVVAGVAALLGAAAAHGVLLGRGPRPGRLAAALLLAPVLDGRLPPALAAPAAALALALALPLAFRAAAEPPPPPLRAPMPRWAPLALLWFHGLLLLRAERAALLRAAGLALGAAVVAWLCARNSGLGAAADRRAVSLVTLGIAVPIAAAALSARALAAEAAARWLLDSSGAGGGARAFGSVGVVALGCALCGAGHGLLLARLLGEAPAALAPAAALCAGALGALTLCAQRRLRRGDERDGDRFVIAALGLGALSEVLLYALRDLQPPTLALLALIAAVASAGWAAPRGRRARRRFAVQDWSTT